MEAAAGITSQRTSTGGSNTTTSTASPSTTQAGAKTSTTGSETGQTSTAASATAYFPTTVGSKSVNSAAPGKFLLLCNYHTL